jgi:hypothetical protein
VEVERVVICHAHCNKAKFTLVKLEQEGSQVLGFNNARTKTRTSGTGMQCDLTKLQQFADQYILVGSELCHHIRFLFCTYHIRSPKFPVKNTGLFSASRTVIWSPYIYYFSPLMFTLDQHPQH